MLRASLSSTKSQETRFHSRAPGARWSGCWSRRRETASSIALAPFGHRRPLVDRAVRVALDLEQLDVSRCAPLRVYASSAQPTAQ